MGKKIEELSPTDKVMIEVGPRTQFNSQTGQVDTIEDAKQIEVTYGFFLSVSQDGQGEPLDEFNQKTGYSKTMNRTIKLLGEVEYEEQATNQGGKINVPTVKPFETEMSRELAKKMADQAAADAKKAADEAQKKADAAAKAEAQFKSNELKLAQQEQQKREAAQKAAALAANKTPDQAKAIANAISESTDKVNQKIDDSGQASAPVTDAVASTQTV